MGGAINYPQSCQAISVSVCPEYTCLSHYSVLESCPISLATHLHTIVICWTLSGFKEAAVHFQTNTQQQELNVITVHRLISHCPKAIHSRVSTMVFHSHWEVCWRRTVKYLSRHHQFDQVLCNTRCSPWG